MKVQVPIEVILQDPTEPVPPTPPGPEPTPTPTPTPVECECSTAAPAVPDTGLQTAANVTNNVSVGLVIVASIIFAVAIGTLMLYLFHLYNHQKAVENNEEDKIKRHSNRKAKAHKWSKALFIASGATAVLAFAAFIGSFIFYSMLQPQGSSALSAPVEEDTHIVTSEKITITVNRYDKATVVGGVRDVVLATTTSDTGYILYASMSGEDANLYLDGDTESEYHIAPTTIGALDDNSWGFSVDPIFDYTAMPLVDNGLIVKQAEEAVIDEEVGVYYGIKVDKDLPYGTYKGEVEYTIDERNGFPSTLTIMQQMTSEICDRVVPPEPFLADGVTINADVPTKELVDTRDGKSYTVSKLADGKCWMRQNLDIGGATEITLTPEDSNVSSNFTLPVAQTEKGQNWASSVDVPHIFDPPATIGSDGKEYSKRELGNYYNWYTATAGTGLSTTTGFATDSICPKGWRLTDNLGNNMTTDFSNLLYVYGILQSSTSSALVGGKAPLMFEAPINLVLSGLSSGAVGNVGKVGYFWSPKPLNASRANYLDITATSVNPWSSSDKYNGFSIRCVAE